MIKHINTIQELQEIAKDNVVLLDFFATWCGPCRMLGPVLEEIDETKAINATIVKIDVDLAQQLAAAYNIFAVPTLVLLKNGQEIKRNSGYLPKQKVIDFVN